MVNQEEITKGIGAHGQWKNRLRLAIDTGKSDFVPEKVKTDNNCDFGKWLYSLNGENSDDYKTIKAMHADFHKEAGRILEMALNGKKDDANHAMQIGSQFSNLSSKLTAAMMAWKSKI